MIQFHTKVSDGLVQPPIWKNPHFNSPFCLRQDFKEDMVQVHVVRSLCRAGCVKKMLNFISCWNQLSNGKQGTFAKGILATSTKHKGLISGFINQINHQVSLNKASYYPLVVGRGWFLFVCGRGS